jgi:transcriptional regulator of acetoin/glycerol metabolism
MSSSTGTVVDLSDELQERLEPRAETTAGTRREASADEIRAAMEKHRGVLEKVWRELGLPNRFVLRRLMKRHGLLQDG